MVLGYVQSIRRPAKRVYSEVDTDVCQGTTGGSSPVRGRRREQVRAPRQEGWAGRAGGMAPASLCCPGAPSSETFRPPGPPTHRSGHTGGGREAEGGFGDVVSTGLLL